MIVVNIKCGLGNQFFQYATGRAIAHREQTELGLFLEKSMLSPGMYQLENFNIKATQVDECTVRKIIKPESFYQRLLNRLIYSVKSIPALRAIAARLRQKVIPNMPDSTGMVNSLNFFKEDNVSDWTTAFRSEVLELRSPCFIRGYFPSYKYFEGIEDLLKSELGELKVELSEQGKIILEKITTTNSVSVHYRRGDAVAITEVQKWYAGIVTEHYYEQSVKYISDKIDDAHFFIFSNDIPWVKKQLNYIDQKYITFVDHNSADTGYEDLYLMSQCKHNITTGYSSFAWWAAYLNSNDSKIITRTRQACGAPEYNFPDDLYPKSWVVIESA